MTNSLTILVIDFVYILIQLPQQSSFVFPEGVLTLPRTSVNLHNVFVSSCNVWPFWRGEKPLTLIFFSSETVSFFKLSMRVICFTLLYHTEWPWQLCQKDGTKFLSFLLFWQISFPLETLFDPCIVCHHENTAVSYFSIYSLHIHNLVITGAFSASAKQGLVFPFILCRWDLWNSARGTFCQALHIHTDLGDFNQVSRLQEISKST